ncbi:MAG: methionyl-tRNA formyltransferase [Lachnospiraceae bacterium]|nr:methionyl-tRNA formyltransferase [Lachnospiraceae bacterium]
MKIVFMGTPDFAAGALEALIAAGHEITAVYTQPDKPKGRGKEVQMTPVKELALKHDIPVYQPRRIKEAEEVEKLRQIPADIFVVAAFGQIVSQEILDIPKYGCVNIHASLLPKYRGAAPIQWAVIDGEEKTGVTIMQMNAGIDTGDILYTKEYVLEPKETGASLFDKLMVLGAEAIVEALPLLETGKLTPTPQDHTKATHAAKLTKQLGELDFDKSAVELERLIRGLNSWPSAYTYYKGKQLKIWEAEVVGIPEVQNESGMQPGTVIAVDKQSFTVAAGDGALKITELQIEGKKRMACKDFLLGYPVAIGDKLGQ